MTRITSLTLLACLASSMAFAQSEAPRASAVLVDLQGSILVNEGEQFLAATEGLPLSSGDRVMALENSTALLRYEDGCDVKVEPETVVTLTEGSPCAGWLLAVEPVAPAGVALGGAGAAATAGGVSPWIYIPAGVIAGVLIYEEFFDDPSSP